MKIFLDSAEIDQIKEVASWGILDGVTTNPKLLYQAGIPNTVENLGNLAHTAFDLGAQEIHLQVWGGETKPMLAIGRQLAAIDPRVSVKVPITEAGLLCARQRSEEERTCTRTAVQAWHLSCSSPVLPLFTGFPSVKAVPIGTIPTRICKSKVVSTGPSSSNQNKNTHIKRRTMIM